MILRGRTVKAWAAWVGLSGSTADRLRGGHIPDPARLNGALRAENLSLTWLVDGTGSPYLVTPCIDEDQAVELVDILVGDEPDLHAVIAHAGDGRYVPVLYQPGEVDTPLGVTVRHVQAVVLTGGIGREPGERLAARKGRCTSLRLPAADWRRLATGYMSNSELFGWADMPGLMADASTVIYPRAVAAAPTSGGEASAIGGYLGTGAEIAVMANQLTASDRDALMHIIRRMLT